MGTDLIPYHCGALWEDEQRTTSFLFRKLRRFRDPTKLDLREAAELIAFVRLLGDPRLVHVFFGWKGKRLDGLRVLAEHEPVARAADVYERENLSHWDDETGQTILARLVASGQWRRRPLPEICRAYLRSRVKSGSSTYKLARELGVSQMTVWNWVSNKPKTAQNRRSRAIASLVIG